MSKKKALYVDIDGTLARFHDADKMFIEAMWTTGFYLYLKPFENLVDAVRMFARKHPEVEVFALSAVLDTDPPFVIGEKNAWLNYYVPEIPEHHRIFTKAGDDKSNYINMDKFDCFLLDDYNKNLFEFEAAGGRSIKFHNDVNHRGLGEFGGSKGNMWTGDLVHYYDSPEKICGGLEEIVFGKIYEQEGQGAIGKEGPIEDGVQSMTPPFFDSAGAVGMHEDTLELVDNLIEDASLRSKDAPELGGRNSGFGKA